jgi:hypothetical protein
MWSWMMIVNDKSECEIQRMIVNDDDGERGWWTRTVNEKHQTTTKGQTKQQHIRKSENEYKWNTQEPTLQKQHVSYTRPLLLPLTVSDSFDTDEISASNIAPNTNCNTSQLPVVAAVSKPLLLPRTDTQGNNKYALLQRQREHERRSREKNTREDQERRHKEKP